METNDVSSEFNFTPKMHMLIDGRKGQCRGRKRENIQHQVYIMLLQVLEALAFLGIIQAFAEASS